MVSVPIELRNDPVVTELRQLMRVGLTERSVGKAELLAQLPNVHRYSDGKDEPSPRQIFTAIGKVLCLAHMPSDQGLTEKSRLKLFGIDEDDLSLLTTRREDVAEDEGISISTLQRREFILIIAMLNLLDHSESSYATNGELLWDLGSNLSGTWHAIWQTTVQGEENHNREIVKIQQQGSTVIMENDKISADNKTGGYLWRGILYFRQEHTLAGEYLAVNVNVSAHGVMFLAINPVGKFIEGRWIGSNIDRTLATGICVLAQNRELAKQCFDRLLKNQDKIYNNR